jgi:hypothetical protein
MIAEVLRDLGAAIRDAGARWYLFGAQAAASCRSYTGQGSRLILAGRAKDLDDVRALLAANSGELDLAHIR